MSLITGEVTAEELRQRLDGAKERVSSQPRPEPRPQSSEAEGSSGEDAEECFRILLLSCTNHFNLNNQLVLYKRNASQAVTMQLQNHSRCICIFSYSVGAQIFGL